jgi:hypothetical protein
MLNWLLSFLTSGILGKILDFISKRQDSANQVTVENIKAELGARALQQQIILTEQGWWVTALIRPLIVYPFVLHITAVTLDSIFKFSWDIAKLPAPMDNLEYTVILSHFLTRPFEKAARGYISTFISGK